MLLVCSRSTRRRVSSNRGSLAPTWIIVRGHGLGKLVLCFSPSTNYWVSKIGLARGFCSCSGLFAKYSLKHSNNIDGLRRGSVKE